MAFTQKHIDALDEAIASGELEVDFGDRKIKYRSIEQLKSAKRHIKKELAESSGARVGGIRTYRLGVSKL